MTRESSDRSTIPMRGRAHVELRDTVATAPTAAIAPSVLLEPFRALELPEARYHVVERLGIGGMGEVSATFDAKIGREIALKTMLTKAPEEMPLAQRRFLREARVQALLEHPAIVPVYDIGLGPDGMPFFTMKRVRGETLFTMLEDVRQGQRATLRRLSRHRLLAAFMTVCMAIDYAHERGVVHRDLKPENIMLGPHGEVYVLDWGLARVTELHPRGPAPDAALGDSGTNPGDMIGTPGFMPPEQVLGQHDQVDRRSDVYALGAILYEILTFKPLHEGADVMAILESTLNPTRVTPAGSMEVPPELLAIVDRATRFHKEQRHATARAISEAIESYLDGDRDQESRAKLAAGRIAGAQRELALALEGPPEQRERARIAALRQAGGALALSPKDPAATALVLEVLSHPPPNTPNDVKRELASIEVGHSRVAMRDNALRIFSWFVIVPFAVVLGIRSDWYAAIMVGVLSFCAILALFMWKRQLVSTLPRFILYCGTSVMFAGMSGLFGPFMLVPALAAINAVTFSLQSPKHERAAIVAIGVLPFLVPMFLELLGVVPASFDFADEAIVIRSRLVNFPPQLTFLFLSLVSSFGIATPVFLTGRLRDQLRSVEAKLALQKWQFAQLSQARPPAG